MPRTRVRAQRLLTIGPRISDVNQQLASIGRSIDVYGLSGAVLAMLAERLLREADSTDQGRLMALAECARIWTGVAEKWSQLQGLNAKALDISPAPPSGSPMPFRLDAFERRKESTADSPSAKQ